MTKTEIKQGQAPRAATGLVGEMVLATGKLVATLEAEVDALKRGDIASLDHTRTDKARLFRNYEARLQAMKSQPALRASVEPAVKEELEEATRKLQRAIDSNVAQLRAAAEANRRLVEAIARAAVDAARVPSYGPPGGMPAAVAARAVHAPVTVSQHL